MIRRASIWAATLALLAPQGRAQEPTARWADEMAAFERQDNEAPYPTGGYVFVGSSSIRMWNLGKWFEDLDPAPLNRGFGGSVVSDVLENLDLLVVKHKPDWIVFYSGDNDIASGKSPDEVSRDFDNFLKRVHRTLPNAHVVVISPKPSPSRWKLATEMRSATDKMKATADDDPRATFVDVWPAMTDENGEPKPELFVDDQLHLSEAGYKIWTELVKAELNRK